ncbi:hypothetical protein THOG11_20285 [Vibrio harveyi]|nr:hypothetical protein TH15OA1_530115 [Vibrio harveyi]CAH1556457.1 hypothetical protein THOD03_20282 [Vibrio harveyi]CAH1563445.1 hypothetical protein THOG11_20285 [Vibrio harveyi]CAK6716367.1 hypothetical protein HORM4_830043 [Vibrio harveyi]
MSKFDIYAVQISLISQVVEVVMFSILRKTVILFVAFIGTISPS